MGLETRYRCDIIVVTWNNLDCIKEGVESILKHTDVKSRLIIVDNASREDTRSYLGTIKGNEMVDIKLIFNNENLGPGRARNIALKGIEADYICFADSDVTVTPGWLSRMIGVAENNAEIGMVNPSSNNFNQLPPGGMSLDDYALSLVPFKNEYIEVGHCISFCMLIKKEVVEKIGFLDDTYILALYEDTDYSMKASAAGYLCVIAKGAYVWHHGHGSTGKVKKMNDIAEKNKAVFYKKWGRPLRILWAIDKPPASEYFKNVLISSIELAREGDYVYLFSRHPESFTREEVFRRVGLVEHANVHLKFYAGRNFKWFCLWRILTKRKKGYDLVITADKKTASLIRGFGIFHKAEVVDKMDFDFIHNAAHRRKFEGD